ncbi:MAG: polynucleotide adenylyltransferase PcnB [Proteobacteria bacterium SW_6_67_9]|nr:MAG: polynucleotide adenylyltransferase PcnB [Proteobacteria bacterium SW_6_67_9]
MPRSEAAAAATACDAADDTHPPAPAPAPRALARDQHSISRKNINRNALKVLYRLHKDGYQAHLVGGGVRDLLLGRQPKDFDIATDATPEQVRALFRNCRLIGRRFRLAHVVFGRDVVEVATFRADHSSADDEDDADVVRQDDGRILRDNVFGTIEEDAFRRDFTVNALYYDISRFAVLDYTGALADLEAKRLRLIGDPEARYREDPVRMLRAARFAAKLGFDVDPATAAPIVECGPLLRDIPPSRLFDEVLKLFVTGHARASLEHLLRLDLLQYLFPGADAALKAGDAGVTALFERALENTDRRLADDKPVTPAFLYAVLLWPVALARANELRDREGESPVMAMQRAGAEAADGQQAYTALPKRFSGPMREIWLLQPKLERYRGKRAKRLLTHPRLRAAWDFLCLRRDAGEDVGEYCDWWQRAMEAHAQGDAPPAESAAGAAQQAPRNKRRRRGGRRRRSGQSGE